MFRIVEDDCPPIPERFSDPLVAFLKECFHKDPAQRPSAEELFEHDWLKSHWGLNKVRIRGDLNPLDHELTDSSSPFCMLSFLILSSNRTSDLRIAYHSYGE
jgi:serine/threonine protein kinase